MFRFSPPNKFKAKTFLKLLGFLFFFLVVLRQCNLQERLIFRGAYYPKATKAAQCPPVFPKQIRFFTVRDGKKMAYATYQKEMDPSANSKKKVLLFFHGNSFCTSRTTDIHGLVRYHLPRTMQERERKACELAVYALDYRGYGQSEGKITNSKQLLHDAEDFMSFILAQGYQVNNIYLMGSSLGGTFAIHLASQYPNVGGLILRSVFSNIPDLFPSPIRQLFYLLIRYHLTNLYKMGKVQCPILHFHNTDDEVVPLTHAYQLRSHYRGDDRNYILQEIVGTHSAYNVEYVCTTTKDFILGTKMVPTS